MPGDFNARGYVGAIDLERLDYGRYLLVKTRVGIHCGFDESAYLYTWKQDRWSLLLESEQDDYAPGHYAAQNFLAVRVSPADVANDEPAPPPLVLTLGFSPWCQSNWQMLYTRLWRASPTETAPRPLIDTKDSLYIGDDSIADGNVTDHDVLIQFRGQSADSAELVRPVVRHYAIAPGDTVKRIAPVALNPAAFVDEWLSDDWKDVAGWTDPTASAAALRRWHERLHEDVVLGDYDGDPMRCRRDRSLWQVVFAKNGATRYYLVRWEAPYRFSMAGIATHRWRGCDVADPMPDNPATLFEAGDWGR